MRSALHIGAPLNGLVNTALPDPASLLHRYSCMYELDRYFEGHLIFAL